MLRLRNCCSIGLSLIVMIGLDAAAQEALMPALKTEACKKIGDAASVAVVVRDSGATKEATTAVMNASPDIDIIRTQLPQLIQDVYQYNELSLHSHRMYRWYSCANEATGNPTKSLEVLSPELKKCQALKSTQNQINCMASVVSEK